MKTILAVLVLSGALAAQQLPNAPSTSKSAASEVGFRRQSDFLFGLVIGEPVGLFTHRPWIGLLAGVGAGAANEARYGKNFNTSHLAIISAGALTGYGINKIVRHYEKKAPDSPTVTIN
jgi:hypothetical protein